MIGSKTHSKNITLQINSNSYRAIGIDLEFNKNRNPKLKEFIYNKKDRIDEKLSLIDMWTIKEASFKAISNLGLNIILLNEVEIDYINSKFYFNNIEGFFQLNSDNKSSITIAYLP